MCNEGRTTVPTATPVKEIDVTRAWKDEMYYRSLSDDEKAQLPVHPAGELDLATDLKSFTTLPVMCYGDGSANCTCCIIQSTATCTTYPTTTSCTWYNC